MAAALGLASCGDDTTGPARTVDHRQVEGLLMQRQAERNPRIRVESASCPEGVVARQGTNFECRLVVEGQTARFTVTVSEVLGTRVRYDIRARQAIVDVAGVVDFVRSRLEGPWREALVDCGRQSARVVEVGGVIDCAVADGLTTRRVQAVVEDLDGTFSLRER
jgi:hypothetical protein